MDIIYLKSQHVYDIHYIIYWIFMQDASTFNTDVSQILYQTTCPEATVIHAAGFSQSSDTRMARDKTV